MQKTLKMIILQRDKYQCVYCGTKQNLTLGHYISKYNMGHGCVDNLQLECKSCNMRNGNENREGGVVKGCWGGCRKNTLRKEYRKRRILKHYKIIGYRFECRSCNNYKIEEDNLDDLYIKKNIHYSECVVSGVYKGHITELTEDDIQ